MSTPPPQRRLDPFALPAETAIRFPLLLLAGVMLAAITAFAVTQILWPGFTPPTTLEEMAQTTDQHVLTKSLLTALGFFALPAAILLAGVILYLTHPARLRRQKKSVRLQPGSAPDLEAELHLLARQAGMSSPPLIELSPGLSTDGQAYGLPKAYILRLGGGMRLLMRKASQVFGAIVLHELAHIHNQDIWRAYSAEGVWIAALWLSFVPFLLATSYGLIWGQVGRPLLGLADFSASTFWASGWRFLLPALQIAACLALMRIIRAGLLRAREVYADWRAATWGAEPGLRKILQQMALSLRPGRRSAWWQLHPSGQDRLDLLADPARLFEISSDLPFLVGVLVAWTIAGVTLILPTAMAAVQAVGSIYPGLSGLVIPLQVITVVIGFGAAAYLLAASLGQQVQRKTMVEALNRQKGLGPYIRLLMPALLLGAGMEAGYWVVPFGDVTTESWPGAGVSILFLLIASGLSWLGLVYARFTALQILGRRSGHSRPKWSLRFLNLGLTLVFGLLYLYFEMWHFCNVYTIETAGNDLCGATSAMGLGAIGIYIVLFLATSLFIAVKHLVAPPRCPHCGARLPSRILIGTIHSACRGSLSEWLFIPDRAPAEPEAPEERAGLPMTAEV